MFEQYLLKVQKDIHYWAHYVGRITGNDPEDIQQELLIMVWEVYCKKGDETKRVFIQQRLQWEAKRLIRENIKKKKRYTEEEISDSIQDQRYSTEEGFILGESIKSIENHLIKFNKTGMLKIFNMMMEGFSPAEISNNLGIALTTVSVNKNKILRIAEVVLNG